MATQLSQGTPSSIAQALQQARRRSAYYSFGDNGLTATVGSNGYLLQMSRYFPDAEYKTGFCVDTPSTYEPYLVAVRASQIYSRGTDPDNVEAIEPIWAWLHEFNDFQPPDFIHDRWPRFTMVGKNTIEGLTITAEYLVRDGTIFQNWEFDLNGGTLIRDLPEIVARGNVLIRDLDFVNESNRFNGEQEGDKSYKTEFSNQGGFLMRSHRVEQDSEDTSAIALFISVFSDNQILSFEANNDGDFHLRWTNELSEAFKKEGKLTITIAYTLQLVSSQSLPDTAPCSLVQFQSAMKHLQSRPAHGNGLTDNPDMDFILRRNLEHILSVCSIPVTLPDEQGMRAIALTCGDLDGHRVATAASL
ncbi:hypothetical protein NW762_003623 [Fusarium torreyae]|uniref:Uncharacterized protein n=1 Tax=Fusarium torreyae TaxID=1237075 RepID=A0A9W8VJ29_9HYPO|nr:hypothetical protein NW762_003623 [Fusarium torreyae]